MARKSSLFPLSCLNKNSLSIDRRLTTRIFPGRHVVLMAERTLRGALCRGIVVGVFIIFIAAKTNGVSPTAVHAFQLPRIDGEVVGFKMIVFTNQRAVSAVRILLTADLGRRLGFGRWRLRFRHRPASLKHEVAKRLTTDDRCRVGNANKGALASITPTVRSPHRPSLG